MHRAMRLGTRDGNDSGGPLRSTVAALTLLAIGCTRAPSEGEIVIGVAGAWQQGSGAMARKGIELALAELNAAPGAPRIRPVYVDDEGKGARAAEVAQVLVDNDTVVAVVGHLSSGAMKSAAKVYDGHLAAVATAASSPELSGISPWAFRIIASDSVSGIELAAHATALGKRRAAILYENNAYGRGLADAFRRNFKGQIVGIDPIGDGQDQDFEPYVTWFAARRPDVVFVAGTDKSGIGFLRAARARGLDMAMMGGVGWRAVAADTQSAEGVWVGVPFSAEDTRPEAKRFTDAFRAKFGTTPDAGAALAYDATYVLAAAARAAGPDRAAVRDWLASSDRAELTGVTGTLRFDANGDPVGKPNVMARIRKGALVTQ
jgi:branched-chain amino acid transport system substrate-binding protein